jgi:hypothetical protein
MAKRRETKIAIAASTFLAAIETSITKENGKKSWPKGSKQLSWLARMDRYLLSAQSDENFRRTP